MPYIVALPEREETEVVGSHGVRDLLLDYLNEAEVTESAAIRVEVSIADPGNGETPEPAPQSPSHVVELTNGELWLVRQALSAYLDSFGHEEADLLQALKEILAKLPTPSEESVEA